MGGWGCVQYCSMLAVVKSLCLLALAASSLAAAQPGPLDTLSKYRQKHRKTTDGRLCSAAFVQDQRTFTDCTTVRNPDGVEGREWCYVEAQLAGAGKNWEYCAPAVNYAAIRTKVEAA